MFSGEECRLGHIWKSPDQPTGKENVPADDGPHHGNLFTVATLKLVVDENSGEVCMNSVDPQ